MKVLIVSDTHYSLENFKRVLEEESPVDMLIHLGDVEHREDEILGLVQCPVHMVAGNNDHFSRLPMEEELEIAGQRVWILHGHQYMVGFQLEDLKEEAEILGVDVVMFGHTHRPYLEEGETLTVLNPGSLTYPRQRDRRPSYIIMEAEEGQKASYQVRYLGAENQW